MGRLYDAKIGDLFADVDEAAGKPMRVEFKTTSTYESGEAKEAFGYSIDPSKRTTKLIHYAIVADAMSR